MEEVEKEKEETEGVKGSAKSEEECGKNVKDNHDAEENKAMRIIRKGNFSLSEVRILIRVYGY